MAWLQTTPKPRGHEVPQAPLEMYGSTDPVATMPPADDYITMIWRTIGLCKTVGMGLYPLDWQDLKAFIDLTGYDLEPYQCELILMCSKVYCSAHSKYANDHMQKEPYQRAYTAEEWAIRGENIRKNMTNQRR